jgi:hypothetical protein
LDYVSKLDQTAGRNIDAVGLALMTKKKAVETEVVEGAGASSRLVLIVKAGTKSGYAGVTPNGKLWRARIYKAAKKQWDTVGTYESPRDAAIQLAIAQKEMEKGFGSLYSPLKRQTTGAPTL